MNALSMALLALVIAVLLLGSLSLWRLFGGGVHLFALYSPDDKPAHIYDQKVSTFFDEMFTWEVDILSASPDSVEDTFDIDERRAW